MYFDYYFRYSLFIFNIAWEDQGHDIPHWYSVLIIIISIHFKPVVIALSVISTLVIVCTYIMQIANALNVACVFATGYEVIIGVLIVSCHRPY